MSTQSTDRWGPGDRQAGSDADRWDTGEDHPTDHGPTFGALLFVPCLLMFVFGLWLLGYAVDVDSGGIFSLGLVVSSLAFLIPIHLLRS